MGRNLKRLNRKINGQKYKKINRQKNKQMERKKCIEFRKINRWKDR